MSIEIHGINRTKGRMKLMARKSPKKLKKGLEVAGKFLLKESRKVTPIDTGDLRASGAIHIEGTEQLPELRVSYSADYAEIVHENPDAFHPIGDYKYLERPAREYRRHMIYLVEKQFR